MEEKYQEGDKIVQTWDNQKDWQKLFGRVILRVGIGAFNPFTNYKQNKVLMENWNEYAFYNFSFGRKFKAGKQRVVNSDNDSGVMSSGK